MLLLLPRFTPRETNFPAFLTIGNVADAGVDADEMNGVADDVVAQIAEFEEKPPPIVVVVKPWPA